MADQPVGTRTWLMVVLGLLITMTTGLSAWSIKTTAGLSERVAVIEANRFTILDGKELWSEIADMRKEMAEMKLQPPSPWFQAKVEALESRITRRLDSLEAKMDQVQAAVADLRTE